MIVSQVIVIGLWCAEAGAAVRNSMNPHAASTTPTAVVVAKTGLMARRNPHSLARVDLIFRALLVSLLE
ncbi:MAG TPA: hypothetical protein VMU14_13150, partial [Acidimicrobiales bacterium]|nr:hypothetical protein [Acidimicrobiales bacterium]